MRKMLAALRRVKSALFLPAVLFSITLGAGCAHRGQSAAFPPAPHLSSFTPAKTAANQTTATTPIIGSLGPNVCVTVNDQGECNIGLGGTVTAPGFTADFGNGFPDSLVCGLASWDATYSSLSSSNVPLSLSYTFNPPTTGGTGGCNGRKDTVSSVQWHRDSSPTTGSDAAIAFYIGSYTLSQKNGAQAVTASVGGNGVNISTCCDKFPGTDSLTKHVNELFANSDVTRSLITIICVHDGGLPQLIANSNPKGLAVQYISSTNTILWDQAQVDAATSTDGQTELGILYAILVEIDLVDVQAGIITQLPTTGQITAQYGNATVAWNTDRTGITSYVHALAHNTVVQNLQSDTSGSIEYSLSNAASITGPLPMDHNTQFTQFSVYDATNSISAYCGCDGFSSTVTSQNTSRMGLASTAAASTLFVNESNGNVVPLPKGRLRAAYKTKSRRRALSGSGNWPNLNAYNPYGIALPKAPVSGAAISQLDGDFQHQPDGSASIYNGASSQIAYLSPDPPGSIAAAARARMSLPKALARKVQDFPAPSLHRSLVANGKYVVAPAQLAEPYKWEADFDAEVHSSILGGLLPPGCLVILAEQRASTDLTSPLNPAYYQLQAYCEHGASIVPNSLRTTWQGTSYNAIKFGIAPRMVSVADTCSSAGQTSLGQQKCFSSVKLLPVAYALAELNQPVSVTYSIAVGNDALTFSYNPASSAFYINNRSVPYPVVPVQPIQAKVQALLTNAGPQILLGPSTAGPTPTPNVPAPVEAYGPYTRQCNTDPSDSSDSTPNLRQNLLKAGFPIPYDGFQAHHINSVCFGGVDDAYNGIWLPTTVKAPGFTNVHQLFTTWMLPSNFTP